MASIGESSSAPLKSTDNKAVIVRVKRKTFHSRLDAFWLEINERPLKRPLLDFENLSISESSGKEEFKTKKVFVQHVETKSNLEATIDIVQSFLEPNAADASQGKTKVEERRGTFKRKNEIQDQLLSKARQEQEVLAKNARFEQIWRSRKGNKEAMHNIALDEMCRVYDIVRVDVEEKSNQVQQQEDISWEDHRLLSSYLPLLREFMPSAASEIESDLHNCSSKEDDYVYDFYAVRDDMDIINEDVSNPFPLVQVDDEDDFYDGPDDSECESDDSNAENNPLNDYPNEISEDEVKSEASNSEASNSELEHETDSGSDESLKSEGLKHHGMSDDDNEIDYGNNYDDGNDNDDDDDDVGAGDGEDWRWSYR